MYPAPNTPNSRARAGSGAGADPLGTLEVGEHEDVKELGAGGPGHGVEALLQSALELVGTHRWRA